MNILLDVFCLGHTPMLQVFLIYKGHGKRPMLNMFLSSLIEDFYLSFVLILGGLMS